MELRAQQMQTLKEALDNDSCEYKIIVGDFNADQSTKEFDLFKDEYSISNGKDGKYYVAQFNIGEEEITAKTDLAFLGIMPNENVKIIEVW